MGKKKPQITETDLINLWMEKYHGITIEKAHEIEPWIDPRDFYDKFKCTQEQHDAWVIEAKKAIKDSMRVTNRSLERSWHLIYLNTSPAVRKEVENG